jgi:hypothetical protein
MMCLSSGIKKYTQKIQGNYSDRKSDPTPIFLAKPTPNTADERWKDTSAKGVTKPKSRGFVSGYHKNYEDHKNYSSTGKRFSERLI